MPHPTETRHAPAPGWQTLERPGGAPPPPTGPSARSAAAALGWLLLGWALSACTALTAYRQDVPASIPPADCTAAGAPTTAPQAPPCTTQATERNALYTLHVVEFDDQGWPFDIAGAPRSQTDSAIAQIRAQLLDPRDCVRLFIYVHGWRHDARTGDSNVQKFRDFLARVSEASRRAASAGEDACDDPVAAAVPAARRAQSASTALRRTPPSPSRIHTVGLYVGWRGLSVENIVPLVYASFWDRKNTADRVAQGSVRELFGRLNQLASHVRQADRAAQAGAGPASAQLRTYVIGHSFGALVVFRALSQSLIDSFSEDLDAAAGDELASVSRFVDMVVLVNPAIEAARFDPVFKAAHKLARVCEQAAGPAGPCEQPRYQAPVLAIFTSEGDRATQQAFPLGSRLSNLFESVVNETQRQAMLNTIGWDAHYRTHTLALAGTCPPEQADPFDPASNPLRYRPPGWTWCFTTPAGAMALQHLGGPSAGPGPGPVYNGPLWNVQVSQALISDHSDIWNDGFRALLLHLFSNEQRYPALP